MRKNVTHRLIALLLTAAMCTGLCTGLTVSAEEMNEGAKERTEQTEAGQAEEHLTGEEAGEPETPRAEEQEEAWETAESLETDKENLLPEEEGVPEGQEVLGNQAEEQSEEQEQTEKQERKASSRASAAGLSDPKIVDDSSMTAGQKVTWDCVWFGSYPQSEVESSDSVYSMLQNAGGWDNKNEITVNGNRYRRMKKGDATCATSGDSNYYNWPDSETWHYFKYEPIKWRVLKINGNQALLLSDVALDNQTYHTEYEDVTWEASTIRRWLNGYGASSNNQGTDYSGKNFIGSAFTSGEQSVIVATTVVNANNINDKTAGGNNTSDKVFLLSESEVYGDIAKPHGFVSNSSIFDEARRCKSSTYAKAMGVYIYSISDDYKGNCFWWLRSPGHDTNCAAFVNYDGYVSIYGDDVHYINYGVRAALNLNLSSNRWSYAGTVCSDGTVEDAIKAEEIKLSKTSIELTVGETETLTAKVLPDNTSIKAVTWTSDNPGIAKVDESGKITAVSAGKTTVSCTTTDGTVISKCDVLVKEPQKNPNNNSSSTGSNKGNSDKDTNTAIKVSRITLSGISKKIAAGKKIKLTAKVKPSNAKNKAVTWKSSNTKAATVNSKGIVTLKKNSGGKKVTITATAKDGSKKKATYQITSMKGVVKKVVISGKKTRTLKAGKTLKLKAKVTASNSKKANKALEWASSNTKYAKVSSKGVVKTYKKGKRKTVKITAMATDGSGKKYSVKIKIK